MTTTTSAEYLLSPQSSRSWRLAPAIVLAALVATLLLWSLGAHAVAEIVGLVLLALSSYSLLYRLAATRRRPVAEREVNATVLPWGSELVHTVSLTRLASWVTVELLDEADQPYHPRGRVLSASGHGTAVWRVRHPCRFRGRWRLGPTTVRVTDPLGLLPPVETRVAKPISLLVLPRIAPLRCCALDVDSLRPGSLRGRVRSEVPPAVAGVRPFEHGDSLSRVDPYATARALSMGSGPASVMVKMFDAAVEAAFWLAVDLDPLERSPLHRTSTRVSGRGRGGGGRGGGYEEQVTPLSHEVEELLVTAAASLASYLLGQQMETGLVVSGAMPRVLAAGSGTHQQQAILIALAEAHIVEDAEDADTFAEPEPEGQRGRVGQARIASGGDRVGSLPARIFSAHAQAAQQAHPTLQHQLRLAQRHMVPGHTVLLLTAQRPDGWRPTLRSLRRQGIVVEVITVGGAEGEESPWGSAGAALHLPEVLVQPRRQADLAAALEGGSRGSRAGRAS